MSLQADEEESAEKNTSNTQPQTLFANHLSVSGNSFLNGDLNIKNGSLNISGYGSIIQFNNFRFIGGDAEFYVQQLIGGRWVTKVLSIIDLDPEFVIPARPPPLGGGVPTNIIDDPTDDYDALFL